MDKEAWEKIATKLESLFPHYFSWAMRPKELYQLASSEILQAIEELGYRKLPNKPRKKGG